MEANLVRILLLIALFFLLSSDYSSVVKQLIPTFDDGEEDSESNEVDITPPRLQVVQKVEENSLKADDNESKFTNWTFSNQLAGWIVDGVLFKKSIIRSDLVVR